MVDYKINGPNEGGKLEIYNSKGLIPMEDEYRIPGMAYDMLTALDDTKYVLKYFW